MGKSLTQKRRREAEAGQERHYEVGSDIDVSTAATATTAPPAKKARVEERRSVFVRSLPPTATNETLTAFFSEHFPVKHATVVTDPKTKVSRGYGFVTFTDAEDAAAAKAKLNQQLLDGRRLRLDIAEPRKRGPDSGGSTVTAVAHAETKEKREAEIAEARRAPKLIVRNLPWSVKTSEDLTKLFRMYGKVKFADLPQSKGKLKGFGFVTLRGRPNAERAMAGVNGKVVDGRTLAVDWAVDKETWEEQQHNSAEAKDDKKTANDKGKGEKSTMGKAQPDSTKTAEQLQAEEDLRNFMANTMEHLEEEDGSDSEDKDKDKDSSDEDSSDDDDDNDDEKDWEDDSDTETETPRPQKALMTDTSSTLFIRNLPFATTDAELKAHFTQFGPVRYARTVMDRATDRPAGTGFVCFVLGDDAQACLRAAPRLRTGTLAVAAAAAKGSALVQRSVLQDERVDRDGRYTLAGRVLQVAQAVGKAEATQLAASGGAAQSARAQAKDRRRLFLLSEGTIAANTPLYALLPPAEIQLREASAKQRQALIKSNPSLHLSLTRLAVRNLPRHMDGKALKALARQAVVGFATDVRAGQRQPLAKEELARGGQQDREAEQRRRARGKGVVKQAKVVFETEKGSKVDEAAVTTGGGGGGGGAKSRGYGFIEYWSHRWALSGLRWLNGHPVLSEDGKKTHRLIVEFAIENANVVARRRALEEKSRIPRAVRDDAVDGKDHTGKNALGKSATDRGAFSKTKSASGRSASGKTVGKDVPKDQAKKGKRTDRQDESDENDTDKLGKKGKADTKLALRQQIIQRKRMMRKKKSTVRAGK